MKHLFIVIEILSFIYSSILYYEAIIYRNRKPFLYLFIY